MDSHIESFVSHLAGVRGASAHTVKAYAEDLSQFARFAEEARGVRGPGAVDTALVRAFLAHLSSERGLARASVARKAAALRAFFRFLVRRGIVERNPAQSVVTPRKRETLPRFLPEEGVALLLGAPDPTRPDVSSARACITGSLRAIAVRETLQRREASWHGRPGHG